MSSDVVLVLAPFGRDASVITMALKDAGVDVKRHASLAGFVEELSDASAAVVTQEALLNADNSALAKAISSQPSWSDIPFILLTLRGPTDNSEIGRLIDLLGNVTILERPLALATLRSAVQAALRARARQRQAQQYLHQLEEGALRLEEMVSERTAQLQETNSRLRREIAHREETELALRQAQKMEAVGQLTGGIAHDFNNLLMVVTGNLDMLRKRLSDDRLLRYANSAMAAAERGARLTKQLLAFSRKQTLKPQDVRIKDVLEDLGEIISRTIGPGIVLKISCDQNVWTCCVDPTQLEMVILNLAINARDAMPDGGTLEITATNLDWTDPSEDVARGEYACISVADTGTGMSDEVLARAFDPFFTTKGPGRGTGLGLSQAYGFAKQSGGTIRIRTKAGAGTNVSLLLPRAQSDAPAKSDHAENIELFNSGTVLIVDDDEGVLTTTSELVSGLGYTVFSARTPERAFSFLNAHQIDVAILDLVMPQMSGVELARQIKRLKPELPILYCSGYPDRASALSSEIPLANFVAKPFSIQEIGAAIRRLILKRSCEVTPNNN